MYFFYSQSNCDNIRLFKNLLELWLIYDAVIEFIKASCQCLLHDRAVLDRGIGAQVGPLSIFVLHFGEFEDLSSDLRTVFDLHIVIEYDQSVVLPEQSIFLPDFMHRFGSIDGSVDL